MCTNHSLTHHQLSAIGDVPYPITKMEIHPYSGALSLYCDRETVAVIESDGRVSYLKPRPHGMPAPVIEPAEIEREDDPAYLAWCEEQEREHDLEIEHGGKTRCPQCDQFAVVHRIIEAHRDPTDVGTCRNCGHVEI